MLSMFMGHAITVLFSFVAFLFVLTVIVFIHELGHFVVARRCGVKVEAFSIGFGREIAGFTDRRGTRWKIGWLPLGGYVKFEGDANPASLPLAQSLDPSARVSPGNFYGKTVAQRASIVAAGPLANFVLSTLIFAMCFMTVGVPMLEPKVESVQPGSAAAAAGILPGDLVRRIDGHEIVNFSDIQRIVMPRSGEMLLVEVDRGGEALQFSIVPRPTEVDDGLGGKVQVGLLGVSKSPSDLSYVRKNPVEALWLGGAETWELIEQTLRFIKRIFTGKESARQIGGVLSIANISGKAASQGVYDLVQIVALLSVSIGLINLFPVPMLDGGHLLYYAIEAARGRPLGADAQEWGFKVGFALVLALLLFAFWNDLARYFPGLISRG
jgi:regulator of sigma E protease